MLFNFEMSFYPSDADQRVDVVLDSVTKMTVFTFCAQFHLRATATTALTSALSDPWSLPLSGPFSVKPGLSGDHIPHPA
eukprot:4275271-Heterocapsa_arctica.AAC.1